MRFLSALAAFALVGYACLETGNYLLLIFSLACVLLLV